MKDIGKIEAILDKAGLGRFDEHSSGHGTQHSFETLVIKGDPTTCLLSRGQSKETKAPLCGQADGGVTTKKYTDGVKQLGWQPFYGTFRL